MRRSVDLLQLAKRNLGVDLSRPDIGVAEHLLNEPNVGSIFMHQRSECVPKQVTRAGLSDFRLQNVSADEIRHMVAADGLPFPTQKQRRTDRDFG